MLSKLYSIKTFDIIQIEQDRVHFFLITMVYQIKNFPDICTDTSVGHKTRLITIYQFSKNFIKSSCKSFLDDFIIDVEQGNRA